MAAGSSCHLQEALDPHSRGRGADLQRCGAPQPACEGCGPALRLHLGVLQQKPELSRRLRPRWFRALH